MLRRQLRLKRQRRHAEDPVERRANLVAHVRNEGALGFCRLLGEGLRDLQLLHELRELRRLLLERMAALLEVARVARQRFLGNLVLGDVARGGVDDLLLRKGRRGPEQPSDRSVFVEVPILEVRELVAIGQPSHYHAGGGPVVRVNEVHVRT